MKALYRFSSVVICVVSVLLIISPSFSLAETCPPLIWDTKVTISNDSGESYWPRITADGNIIHVSWMNYETSTAFYKRSLDNGATWQDHHEFSAYLYSNFDVIAYDNVSTAVWLDKSGSQQIVRSTYSENAGETWPYSI